MKAQLTTQERILGLLLGGAVGDAIGLPAEGMSAERIARRWPGELKHRFVFGRGMMSDDTEHAAMTAQALILAAGDVEMFRRCLAWKLRWWFLGLPAGVGLATARACVRLWLGLSPERSGVYSAGNGPAMRSAIIGAAFAHDETRRRGFVRASTRLTHTDPRAETAALAVAEAAAGIVRGESLEQFQARLPALSEDSEWLRVCEHICRRIERRTKRKAVRGRPWPQVGSDGLRVSHHSRRFVCVAAASWRLPRGDSKRCPLWW